MDLDDGPPPDNSGNPGLFGQVHSNKLATQAHYSHDNVRNMDCEETRPETVDFGTYAATLTSTSNTDDADTDVNNTLEMILRNTALPEDQIQAISNNWNTKRNNAAKRGK